MLKHRGFPGRLPSTDHQFVIRRANHKDGPARIIRRERYADRKPCRIAQGAPRAVAKGRA